MIGEQFLIKRAYNANQQDIYNADFKLDRDPQAQLRGKVRQNMPVRLGEHTQWAPGKQWNFNKSQQQQKVNVSYPFLGGTATTAVNVPVPEQPQQREDDAYNDPEFANKLEHFKAKYLSDEDYVEPFDDGESYHGEWETEDIRNNGVRYNPNAADPFFQRDRLQNQAEALRKAQQEYDRQQAQKPAVKAPVIRQSNTTPGQIRKNSLEAQQTRRDTRLAR